MQILRCCRCNLRSPSTDCRSDHGSCWWSVVHHCNPSPNQLRKLAKSRLTDRPTVRRSDHGPWSVSVDRDFPYQPLTQTTVDQHGPSFDPRSVVIMPPRRANTRNVNARNANTVPLVPDQRVSNAEFQNTIQPFVESMNNQNNQQVEGDKLREIAK
ncbi:hypothetical protein MTR67_043309, partial [Solanum verrucosum]